MVDVVVIGGGFFGANLAIHFARGGERVVLLEREPDLMQRASLTNQARIHVGYHYPRSFVTALRSRRNAPRFTNDFRDCVVDSFPHYYAIGRNGSNVTAAQFATFCNRVGAPLSPAPGLVSSWFNTSLIEGVFKVEENVFDADILRQVLARRLVDANVSVRLGTEATSVRSSNGAGLEVVIRDEVAEDVVRARRVFNCTYSRLNGLLAASNLPRIPLKHELAELLLVEPPDELQGAAVSVMCGPFFSLTPFPTRRLHALSHVRYTPHRAWTDGVDGPWRDPDEVLASPPPSHATQMLRDAARYLPFVAQCRAIESLWEIKTVLPRNEIDDGRPILFRADHGLPGLMCVTGAKLDNIYDLLAAVPSPTNHAGSAP